MVAIDLVDRTLSWAWSAAMLSFGFGCHALLACFRVGRCDPDGQGMAARSLTKALASSSTHGQVSSRRRMSPLDLRTRSAATCRTR